MTMQSVAAELDQPAGHAPTRRSGEAPLRLLLLEDNPGDLRLTTEALGESASVQFSLTTRARVRDAVKQLRAEKFDAVLLDLSLPDSHGLDTVVRLLAAAPEVPMVVLTGTDDEDLGSLAIAAGVQEFLVKGQVDGRTLRRTLRYAVERCRLEATLQQAARNDALGRLRSEVAPGLSDLLTVITGFTQLILARAPDERTARDLRLIAAAAEQAAPLVRRLSNSRG